MHVEENVSPWDETDKRLKLVLGHRSGDVSSGKESQNYKAIICVSFIETQGGKQSWGHRARTDHRDIILMRAWTRVMSEEHSSLL